MTNNYRYLNLTKTQVKTIFQKEGIDFATKEEKKKFKYFNISSYYIMPNILKTKFFISYEEAEKYIEDNPAYEKAKIIQKFILLMGE